MNPTVLLSLFGDLQTQVLQLRAENEQLRAALAEAEAKVPKPRAPKESK